MSILQLDVLDQAAINKQCFLLCRFYVVPKSFYEPKAPRQKVGLSLMPIQCTEVLLITLSWQAHHFILRDECLQYVTTGIQ